MKCPKCGALDIELTHYDRAAIISCIVCGRQGIVDKIIVGRNDRAKKHDLRKGAHPS